MDRYGCKIYIKFVVYTKAMLVYNNSAEIIGKHGGVKVSTGALNCGKRAERAEALK